MWLRGNPSVLVQAGTSAGQLWTSLARLFNRLEVRPREGSLMDDGEVAQLMADEKLVSRLQYTLVQFAFAWFDLRKRFIYFISFPLFILRRINH